MKMKIPRIRKKIIIAGAVGLVILLLALGIYFHVVPGPGNIAHIFDPKATATPLQPIADAGTLLNISLENPLIADSLASPGYQSNPLSVQFFDMSRGDPTAWLWDFGDNTTATDQNPVHDYAQKGIYNVTL